MKATSSPARRKRARAEASGRDRRCRARPPAFPLPRGWRSPSRSRGTSLTRYRARTGGQRHSCCSRSGAPLRRPSTRMLALPCSIPPPAPFAQDPLTHLVAAVGAELRARGHGCLTIWTWRAEQVCPAVAAELRAGCVWRPALGAGRAGRRRLLGLRLLLVARRRLLVARWRLLHGRLHLPTHGHPCADSNPRRGCSAARVLGCIAHGLAALVLHVVRAQDAHRRARVDGLLDFLRQRNCEPRELLD